MFGDARNYDSAKNLKDGILAINVSNILYSLKPGPVPSSLDADVQSSDLAYLFHTSGTSSGLPKPIPQTHHAAVGVLPSLPGGETHATFSTTPLYHGGIADCLRAWTSGAAIHLFPGTQPITAVNVHRAVARANAYLDGACPVTYFTSVPYVLQMLAAESSSQDHPSGMEMLQTMNLVGAGGAALPASLGEELVANGVKLVSRFGSAECGFLLSSHRDYAKDREWSWLRADPALQPRYYDFEPQAQADADGDLRLFEFVVKPEWPHRGKMNRPDGSFATADLFEQHPTILNAWRYHSRADAQITLVNGKKFDPAPVEGELLASAIGKRILDDAMIFGTGREAPGLLVIPKRGVNFVNDQQVIDEVWPAVEEINNRTQVHAKIGRLSIVVVRGNADETTGLPKSSKGTILRRQAESMFSDEIEGVYGEGPSEEQPPRVDVPDSKVLEELIRLFNEVLGRHVNSKGDLFAQGVDSIACLQIRKRISKTFFRKSDMSLPLNIIYDQGSIDRLSSYILRCRNSADMVASDGSSEDSAAEEQLMLDLVDQYRHSIQTPTGSFNHQEDRVIILTGATGFLGAHILDLLLRDSTVSKVICLVRSRSSEDAAERIGQSLKSRALAGYDVLNEQGSRLVCMPSSLPEARLGLSETDWNQIASQATMIIHSAWPVNFNLKLKSFEDQFEGIRNLLQLRDATNCSAARFVFISSIAAVSGENSGGRPIPEKLSCEPEDVSPLGYSRSKWVAENIITAAKVGGNFSAPSATADRTISVEERSPIITIRVGQLCGNEKGVWNTTEAYPIMLSSAKITGCLPELDESLSWLPVNIAARAVLDLSCGAAEQHARGPKFLKMPVYHVVNRHQEPTWSDMVQWLAENPAPDTSDKDEVGKSSNRSSAGKEVEVVSPKMWLHRLENALENNNHSARSLLHFWKTTYSEHHENPPPVFDTRRADAASETMRMVQPLSKEDVLRMWKWIQSTS